MSSNAPHSSMRRYVIAAIAAIGCLLPAACDVAAASPGYHNDRPGQGQQGGRNNNGGPGPAPTAPARTARAPPRRRPPSRRTSRATRVKARARAKVKPRARASPARARATRATTRRTVPPSHRPSTRPPPPSRRSPPQPARTTASTCWPATARRASSSRTTASRRRPPASRPRSARSRRQATTRRCSSPTRRGSSRPNTAFTLKVSTRNLVRDRFLGAAVGRLLPGELRAQPNGIQRGHFHTACRMLSSLRSAPAPDPVPAFFVATQDNGGGATPGHRDRERRQGPARPAASPSAPCGPVTDRTASR